jgi:hypothetical protein
VIRRLPETARDVLSYEAAGIVTRDDVRRFQQDLRSSVGERQRARVLVDLVHLDGVQPDAVWQDLKHTPEYTRLVDRVAVIGNENWERWATQLAGVLPGVEARFFDAEQRIEARSWLGAG